MVLRNGALRIVWTRDAPLSVVRRIFPAGSRRQLFFRLPVIREVSWWTILSKANVWTPTLPAEKKLVVEFNSPLAYLISRPGQDGRLIGAGFCKEQLVFIKYPTGPRSQQAFNREREALHKFGGSWCGATVPVVQTQLQDHGLVLNDIGERKAFLPRNDLAKAINCHVIKVIKNNLNLGYISQASHAGWTLHELAEYLSRNSNTDFEDYKSLIQRWLILAENILTEKSLIPICPAHGDLTLWNSWLSDQVGLSIIDFERFDYHSPAGFDLFHFYISSLFDSIDNIRSKFIKALDHVKKIIISEISLSERTVDDLALLYCIFCSGLRLIELNMLQKTNLNYLNIIRLLIESIEESYNHRLFRFNSAI